MKKRTILFPLLLSSLTISSGVLITNLTNKNNVKEVNASYYSHTNGLFQKVTDPADLNIDDEVILVSDGGYAFDDIWGNPGYVHASRDGVRRSMGSLVLAEDSLCTPFHIKAGTRTDTIAFQANLQVYNKPETVYLAFNDSQYTGEFGNIGYWYGDRTGVSKFKDAKTDWTFSYTDGVSYITSVDYGGSLTFTTQYSNRFYRSDYPDVSIYKRISVEGYSILINSYPDKTEYDENEKINLSGLSITFKYNETEETYTYNENPDMFSIDNEYAHPDPAKETKTVTGSFASFPFTFEITVNDPVYEAYKVTSPLSDYRGTYIISDVLGYGYNFEDAEEDPYGCKYTLGGHDNIVSAKNSERYNELKVSVIRENGKYNLKISDTKYLDLSNNQIKVVTNPATKPTINIVFEGGMAIIKNASGSYFYFDEDTYEFGVGSLDGGELERNPMHLFKCPISSETETAIDNYMTIFFNKTSDCDPTGTYDVVTGYWSDLTFSYNSLNNDAKGVFANVTYTHNQERGGSIEDMADRYDYIMNKYSLTNFMERGNDVQDTSYLSINHISNNVIDTSITTLSVIIVILSISTLGAIILIKKRKTNY